VVPSSDQLQGNRSQTTSDVISSMNHCLADLEKSTVEAFCADSGLPLVFFSFLPRSGSTLMAQCLARTGSFAYITNLTARFWASPTLGAQIEKEIGLRATLPNSSNWASDYGRTEHPAEPHEFGYFWNQFAKQEHHQFTEEYLPIGDIEFLVRQVAAIQSISGQPFFFKNSIAGYNADLLAKWFPNAFFIFVRRDPAFVAQSILKAREVITGSMDDWWSLKPEEFLLIQKSSKNRYEEIAMQVLCIQRRLDQHRQLLNGRSVTWDYTEFCKTPREHLGSLGEILGLEIANAKIPPSFDASSQFKVSSEEFGQIQDALRTVELPECETDTDE
jgi:hypothetical protein